MRAPAKPRAATFAASMFVLLFAAGALAGDKPSPQAVDVICAGNDIYVVCVNDDADDFNVGRYTARTGPVHPVPERNLLFGGEFSGPGTSFNSYRSFTSGTTYTQGAVGGAVDLDGASHTTTPIGTTGVRTTWEVSGPDEFRIEQVVNVNGTTFSDSNVEVTTTITNTGDTSTAFGVRYLWDFQIGEDDGPTYEEQDPDGPIETTEQTRRPVDYGFYRIEDNDFDDPRSPLYNVLGTAEGPPNLTPAPTEPTQISYACWSDAVGTEFDYTTTPGRDIATLASDCRGFAGGDSSTLYWWGRDADSARTVGPGESFTERALLLGVPPGDPPPGHVDHFKCYIGKSRGFQSRVVTLEDQFGRSEANVVSPVAFCNPVSKNDEGIVNEKHHLKCYRITEEPRQFPSVRIRNQFGEDSLDVVRAVRLCAPSSKGDPRADPGPPPDDLDHYKCYHVSGSSFTGARVTLEDQWGRGEFALLPPNELCNPVSKDGSEIINEVDHPVCYPLRPNSNANRRISARDQFGLQKLTITKARLLCVPSEKEVVGAACEGANDQCIEADGIATAGDGIPGAAEVQVGDPLTSFPDCCANSGLDLFDQDGNGQWTFGAAGDDLHAEDPQLCPGAERDGFHDLGKDCKVLDINDDLQDQEPVDCDLEIGAFNCAGFLPQIKYHDVNFNNDWDTGEDLVLDANLNSVFD